MSGEILKIKCLVLGDPYKRVFSVEIAKTKDVNDLKNEIKAAKEPSFRDVLAESLDLYKVSIPRAESEAKLANKLFPEDVSGSEELDPMDELWEQFPKPEKKRVGGG